jgi:hypothetical protein
MIKEVAQPLVSELAPPFSPEKTPLKLHPLDPAPQLALDPHLHS